MLESFRKLPGWLRLTFLFPLLFLNGFLLTILLGYLQPFVNFLIIATIIAFLLELAVNLLQQRGMNRKGAIITVLMITLLTIIVLTVILVPLLIEQLNELINNAPTWIEETTKGINNLSQLPILKRLSIDLNAILNDAAKQLSEALKAFGGELLQIFLGTIASAANFLLVIILTLFLLIGGDKFWHGILSWLPFPWNQKIPIYLQQTFKDYFFTRLMLAGISSIARTISFLLLGIPYAVLFAFGLGIGNLVPFLAGVISILATILLSFKGVGLAIKFLISAVIIDQLTDSVLAPRLMGEVIGLNPVWLIISLFIGAKFGGILGLFLAVPLASVIKKIVDDLRIEN